jgi:O-antigen ligase
MIFRRAIGRFSASARSPWGTNLSLFLILVCLHAAGAIDAIAGLTLPGLADTTIQTAALAVWLSLYGYSVFALFRTYGAQWLIDVVRSRSLLLIILLIVLISPLWSLDPSLSIQRVVHLLGTTLIGIFIGYHFETPKIWASLLLALSILIIGGTLAAIFLPTLAQSIYEADSAWQGLQGDKNKFGFAATMLVIVALCRMQSLPPVRSRSIYGFIVIIALVALVMSKSMTSAAALMLSLVVLLFYFLAAKLRISIAATFSLTLGCVLLTSVVAALSGFDRFDQWAGLVGRSSDLTGRTDIWGPVWRLILDKPVLGYGYGALWFPRFGWEDTQQALLGLTWTAFHAHNGFLQLASEIGLPAAVLSMTFALISLAEMIGLFYLRASPYVLFVIAFQVAFLLANTFEALLLVDRTLTWIMFVALPLSALRSYRRLSWPVQDNRIATVEG